MTRHREYREKIESLLRNSVSQVLCDRVSAQKLSESSVVYGTGVHVLDVVLLFLTPLQQIKWK